MLIQHTVELLHGNIGFIQQHVVMSRTSSPLDSHMRAEIDIVLPRMGHIVLDYCAWQRISMPISLRVCRREEANVVTLLSDNNCHLGLPIKLADDMRYEGQEFIPYCEGLADPVHP